MAQRILITGGAGSIGSHLTDHLLENGYGVRILDNLDPQVHGPERKRPAYLSSDAELVVGDVRDHDTVARVLEDVDAVYHFASAVGVGQSMYKIAHYTDVNNLGTAVLLEAISKHPVERLIVASSMSLYGEGLYVCADGTLEPGHERGAEQLRSADWELRDRTGEVMTPVPTPESKPQCVSSVYALSKYDQECMSLMIGRAYGIPVVALRFFNVFGTRQALSNPYTGVMAIFASRLLNDKPPVIFEDGCQQRDFVSVLDVAHACLLALKSPGAAGRVFNIGGGQAYTIAQVARTIAEALDKPHINPEITGSYRVGDIRHCFADISLAREVLGYEPCVPLEEGVVELAEWLQQQDAQDKVMDARTELRKRGLLV